MAHWIITDHGKYRTCKCSTCGSEWTDSTEWTAGITFWTHCDICGDIIKDTENEYLSDLVHRPEIKEEKSESKELAELGKCVADGFAAGLESGGFVMMARKDYDKMLDDFNICIEQRDREMFKLEKKLREVTEERDLYDDILKRFGINYHVNKIVMNSINVDEFNNPVDFTKMIQIRFKVEV